MNVVDANSAALPKEICGCAVVRALAPQTFLATGPGGRAVVLKAIDPDCLLGNSLHPSVRDRLSRIRELAHASVPNLFGVERDGNVVYLMWEYVEGTAFDDENVERSPRDIAAASRELALAVDLLHMQGIVHGALIGSNVIISPAGLVRVTHLSPLLYTDPAVDIECVWNLLEHAAGRLGERGWSLAQVVVECRNQKASLRHLATRLGPLTDARGSKRAMETEAEYNTSPRRHALIGAMVAAFIGIAIAWGAWRVIETGHLNLPQGFRLPFHTTTDH